jgi:Zn-dependent alcohol dehydrogenase
VLTRELGATHTLGSRGAETLAEIRKITGGGTDFALEASAVPAVFRLAVDVLRCLGTCILVGNARAGTEVSFAAGRPDCARRISFAPPASRANSEFSESQLPATHE